MAHVEILTRRQMQFNFLASCDYCMPACFCCLFFFNLNKLKDLLSSSWLRWKPLFHMWPFRKLLSLKWKVKKKKKNFFLKLWIEFNQIKPTFIATCSSPSLLCMCSYNQVELSQRGHLKTQVYVYGSYWLFIIQVKTWRWDRCIIR